MRKRLHISKGNLTLGLDSVTKTFAILAQRRKGKTYTASVIAEEMVKAGIPWVALDPTGAWWGLRASADGKKEGLPVLVIGGQHGQLPLEALIEVYPDALSKQEVGERAGYNVGPKVGGTFGNILGKLRSLGLIDYPRQGEAVALPLLFLEGS